MVLSNLKQDSTIGVVGVCGVNGNLIARIFLDHGYNVIANDLVNKEDCRFYSSLTNYDDLNVYYGQLPEEFFIKSDYIVLPTALIENKSSLYEKVLSYNIPIVTVEDVLNYFEPVHPVICVSGTNGKTTTTTLLKHFAKLAGKHPCEHNLVGMQGNVADIPPLQARLSGDINILETGTFGVKGSIHKLVSACHPDAAIITNITPDHLEEGSDFLSYARVKGELVELLKNKTLIVNGDDPTIQGLLNDLNYTGNVISFGLDYTPIRNDSKLCFCGKDVAIEEIVAGSGIYACDCGIEYMKPDYVATNINDKHNKFTVITPDNEEYEFNIKISGLHNIYNSLGSIVMAKEIMGISFEDLQEYIASFEGVSGRMEVISTIDNKTIMVDYAHNPAGITTVMKELTNMYSTVTNVITSSSESGFDADMEILERSLEYSDFVVPASHNSYLCAKQLVDEGKYVDKIVLPDTMPEGDKEGTLGANVEQVKVGFNKALTISTDLIVCTGEAAFKFKDYLID